MGVVGVHGFILLNVDVTRAVPVGRMERDGTVTLVSQYQGDAKL